MAAIRRWVNAEIVEETTPGASAGCCGTGASAGYLRDLAVLAVAFYHSCSTVRALVSDNPGGLLTLTLVLVRKKHFSLHRVVAYNKCQRSDPAGAPQLPRARHVAGVARTRHGRLGSARVGGAQASAS